MRHWFSFALLSLEEIGLDLIVHVEFRTEFVVRRLEDQVGQEEIRARLFVADDQTEMMWNIATRNEEQTSVDTFHRFLLNHRIENSANLLDLSEVVCCANVAVTIVNLFDENRFRRVERNFVELFCQLERENFFLSDWSWENELAWKLAWNCISDRIRDPTSSTRRRETDWFVQSVERASSEDASTCNRSSTRFSTPGREKIAARLRVTTKSIDCLLSPCFFQVEVRHEFGSLCFSSRFLGRFCSVGRLERSNWKQFTERHSSNYEPVNGKDFSRRISSTDRNLPPNDFFSWKNRIFASSDKTSLNWLDFSRFKASKKAEASSFRVEVTLRREVSFDLCRAKIFGQVLLRFRSIDFISNWLSAVFVSFDGSREEIRRVSSLVDEDSMLKASSFLVRIDVTRLSWRRHSNWLEGTRQSPLSTRSPRKDCRRTIR